MKALVMPLVTRAFCRGNAAQPFVAHSTVCGVVHPPSKYPAPTQFLEQTAPMCRICIREFLTVHQSSRSKNWPALPGVAVVVLANWAFILCRLSTLNEPAGIVLREAVLCPRPVLSLVMILPAVPACCSYSSACWPVEYAIVCVMHPARASPAPYNSLY